MPYSGKIKKVWVSGPPPMNETFDKSFEVIGKDLGLGAHEVDIM